MVPAPGSIILTGTSMGIIAYIKIGIVMAAFLAGGWFIGKMVYNHEQKVIANQATIIANQKVEQKIMAQVLIAQSAYNKKRGVIQKKETQNEADVQDAISSGDVQRVIDMFNKLSADTEGNPPADGAGGGTPAPALGKAPAAPK